MSSLIGYFIAVIFVDITILLSQCETIHFTNSPHHLLKTKNYTSYEIDVPGAEPITIIELKKDVDRIDGTSGSDELILASENNGQENEQYGYGSNEQLVTINGNQTAILSRRSGEHYSEKELISRSRGNYRNDDFKSHSVNSALSVTISSNENNDNFHGQKKTHGSHELDTDGYDDQMQSGASSMKMVYSTSLLEKFIKDYAEKIQNADTETKERLKLFERLANDRKHENNERKPIDRNHKDHNESNGDGGRKEQKRYTYYGGSNSGTSSSSIRDKDKNGWVTLDAVPWSTSKVSKWQPHGNRSPGHVSSSSSSNNLKRPVSNSSPLSYDSRPYAPVSSPKPPQFGYGNEDDYHDYVEDQNAYQSSSRPISHNPDKHKPYSTDYGSASTDSKPWTSDYVYNRPHYNNNKFIKPNKPEYNYEDNRRPSYTSSSEVDKPWPNEYENFKKPFHYASTPPNRYSRPSTHPDNGNGEWVLISTTKGYQYPRKGQRALRRNRTITKDNDEFTTSFSASIPLTVYASESNMKPIAVSHGGVIEVEPSFESVEQSAQNAMNNNTSNSMFSSFMGDGHKKKRLLKAVPVLKKSPTSDSSAVLAAVGAGMVPATMAMLMPVVLGRKRRSVSYPINRLDLPIILRKNNVKK